MVTSIIQSCRTFLGAPRRENWTLTCHLAALRAVTPSLTRSVDGVTDTLCDPPRHPKTESMRAGSAVTDTFCGRSH